MKKKWMKQIVLLCSVFFLTLNLVFAEAVPIKSVATGPGVNEEETGNANLVASDSTTPTGYSGKDAQVKITIKNLGAGGASNVSVRPNIKAGTDSPFEPTNTGIKTIHYIHGDGGTGTASFTLRIKEKAITGYYSVDFDVVYFDEGSYVSQSKTLTSYIFIEGVDESETSTETDISISLRNSPTPPTAAYSSPLLFDLYLNNFGKSDAYSVSITPTLSASTKDYPFEIEKATYEIALKTPLLGTESQPDEAARNQIVHYSMNVRNDVTTGYYPVVFKITAKDEHGKEYNTEQTVFFHIDGNPEYDETTSETTTQEETTKTSVPRLIITGYETDLETVNAGDVFKLVIHVKNTSTVTSVSNVKFTLSAADDAFLPVSGSSTLFISHVGIGQTVNLEVDMTANASLEAKSYPLTLEAEYEDSNINAYTAKESISIPISQEIRMSIGEIEVMPSALEVGSQSNIMFPINNMGKSKIYNATVTFEGDTVSGGETFRGNIDPGATSNVDVMLTAAAATLDDPIVYAVVTYEDDKGKQYEMKKSFELYVSEPYINDVDWQEFPNWEDMEPVEPESSVPKWAVAAGVAAAVAAIAAVVLVIRKKRKKAAEGMDEDENF